MSLDQSFYLESRPTIAIRAGIQVGNIKTYCYVVEEHPKQSLTVMTFFAVVINVAAFADPIFIVPSIEGWTFSGYAPITVFFCTRFMFLLQRYGAWLRAKREAGVDECRVKHRYRGILSEVDTTS